MVIHVNIWLIEGLKVVKWKNRQEKPKMAKKDANAKNKIPVNV